MDIQLPKKRPRIRQKPQAPDQRTVTVCPIRAASDRRLTPMQLRALLILCSYTNKAGVTWVGLERVGQDLSVSRPRAGHLVKRLIELGYVRVIHKGFKGYCADSRQVIFNPEITADEAAAIAGELAPYQIEQQQREAEQMQAKQAKQQARRSKRKVQTGNSERVAISAVEGRDMQLVHEDMHRLKQIYSAEILSLAISEAGPDAPIDAIESAADRLLR